MPRNPPSVKLRQSQNGTHMLRKEPKKDAQKKAATTNPPAKRQVEKAPESGSSLFYPGGDTAFKALLSARLCAAIWSHVTDCDETYNYWEPMHYLVFGKGLQTWEYSPEFALRSYTYLMIHAAPAYIYHKILQPNPLLIFYFTRCLLGLLSSFVEVYFYKAVCREFGVQIGRMCLAFQIFSAGMFISSTALLPSTFAMYMFAGACAAWWTQKYPLAVFFIALGALLGWPFAGLLGLPIAYDMIIMKKMYKTFAQWALISALVIIIPMTIIDSCHYGKLVVASFNIVKYNVLGGAGPNLYGTEPFSFYFINGFLNFNIIWIFALITPLMLLLQYLFVPAKTRSTLNLSHCVSLSPLFLWLAVFLIQPHKEERFLFPIYPMICLCGAISIDILQKLVFRVWCLIKKVSVGTHYLDYTYGLMVGAILISSLLGISRIVSLYSNYHAPLDLLMELNRYPTEGKISDSATINVCLGKDWHRYPSSFFLPNSNWNIRFVQSEFKGILPAPYSSLPNATKIIHEHFNDQNREEPSVYFDINKCHFLLDLNLDRETELEPIYAKQKDKWKLVKALPFLNTEKSSRIHRAFYIPFVTSRYVRYGQFSLLQNNKIRFK